MLYQPKAVAFDVDAQNLVSLRQAIPEWEIEALDRATRASLARDWSPGRVDLVVLGAGKQVAETLSLCQGLRSQAGRAHAPLVVLVPPRQGPLARAVAGR
jgi:hypothetical protein